MCSKNGNINHTFGRFSSRPMLSSAFRLPASMVDVLDRVRSCYKGRVWVMSNYWIPQEDMESATQTGLRSFPARGGPCRDMTQRSHLDNARPRHHLDVLRKTAVVFWHFSISLLSLGNSLAGNSSERVPVVKYNNHDLSTDIKRPINQHPTHHPQQHGLHNASPPALPKAL